MIVDTDVRWIIELKPKSSVIEDAIRWKKTGRYKLDLRMLTDGEIDKLIEVSAQIKGSGWRALADSINTFRLMKEDPTGQPIGSLKQLEVALIEHFLKDAPNKWCFYRDGQHRLPYYIARVEYHKPERREGWTSPAHTDMTLSSKDDSKVIRWDDGNLSDGITVAKLLAMKRCRTETPKLVEQYQAELVKYSDYDARVGEQFAASGTGYSVGAYWYSSKEDVAMEREGARSKVIIDDGSEPEERGRRNERDTADLEFWLKAANPKYAGKQRDRRGNIINGDDDDSEEVNIIVVLPTHPWIRVFDIQRHEFLDIHVNDLEPWQFDDTLADKLILPPNTLNVLDALVKGADKLMEDIVKGKTGGTIVLCTGEPGTGKTLSAEVFAEKMHKPLYTVQCSQLGLNPEELEKQLGIVLARANRWKCILLIDEADVYVRTRGEDIIQNAMVGTWLRVLEYYRGIMFMTSNKATMIDDAIMSRATAWIRYERPRFNELERIWAVLLAQYEMETPTELIPELVRTWPKATGRNVKNLIKLARQLRMSEVAGGDMELFKLASTFLDVPATKVPGLSDGAG